MNYEDHMALEEERRIRNKKWVEKGVSFTDLERAYIDKEVTIGSGTHIGPNVVLEGATSIGFGCQIRGNTRIKDCIIGDETEVEASVLIDSEVGNGTKIGPFAYLRPGSKVGNHCKIGDFVEVKNSSFGDGSKASHLTYIGDSDVGKDVNIGCGVIFVNYDGRDKHRSIVKDGAFIGCNTNLLSPITVEEEAYIAAGSTVTTNVPKRALYVARAKGKVIEGWVERRGLLKKKGKV
jgi:bifunctional UDP-N-acetylglucosamine pyrophosphorylase/glucosamine-1-phosphate N-acetyltransferase